MLPPVRHDTAFFLSVYADALLGRKVGQMEQNLLAQLETPCVVIDVAQARRNIQKMQAVADQAGCTLRPHIKTHKMPLFARMQLEAGCGGITCAKVSEAEVMAEGGCDDIFIAYPLVGAFRIRRALALRPKLKRLILAVDSMASAQPLSDAASAAGVTLEVRLEIDTGLHRTGVPRDRFLALAKEIAALPSLNLTGIYTFRGLVCHDAPTLDNQAAAQEEGELMAEMAHALRTAGIPIQDVSAGSTPTGALLAKTGLVTEIRPGTYIFNDHMVCMEKAAEPSEIAVRLYATVVSTPVEGYAVIDGGTKTFPMDILLDQPPYYYPGYALVAGDDNLQLRRMNEEHGIITAKNGRTGLSVGQVLELIPIHVCTAVNMQNRVWLYENGALRTEKVAARGCLV